MTQFCINNPIFAELYAGATVDEKKSNIEMLDVSYLVSSVFMQVIGITLNVILAGFQFERLSKFKYF